jgi:hypothetical protein
MGYVSVQLLEVGTQGCLNCGRKMVASVGGMEGFVAFLEERSKSGMAHLELGTIHCIDFSRKLQCAHLLSG